MRSRYLFPVIIPDALCDRDRRLGNHNKLDFGLEKEKKAAGAWHKLPKEQ
ncbi:hypothetical protein [Tumidithrix helvetica]